MPPVNAVSGVNASGCLRSPGAAAELGIDLQKRGDIPPNTWGYASGYGAHPKNLLKAQASAGREAQSFVSDEAEGLAVLLGLKGRTCLRALRVDKDMPDPLPLLLWRKGLASPILKRASDIFN